MSNYILIQNYEENLWQNSPDLQHYINTKVDDPSLFNREEVPQASGPIASTVALIDLDERWLLSFSELQPLIKWVKYNLEKSITEDYGIDNPVIMWNRIWVNKMFKGSSVEPHTHSFNGFVAVYYLHIPEHSGQLVINGEQLYCKTQDLVIHHSDVIHSVSEHLSDEPRISLIFEATLK